MFAADAVGAHITELELRNPRSRLEIDAGATGANLECEVDVLAVSRRVRRGEAPKLLERRVARHHRHARTVVGLAQVAVVGPCWIVAVPEMPGRAVAPDHAAGRLQSSIGQQQLGSNQGAIGAHLEHAQQAVQPTFVDQDPVAQEMQVFASRQAGDPVAAARIADRRGLGLDAQPGYARQLVHMRIAAGVVDQDHFESSRRWVRRDPMQAAQARRVAVLCAYDDADDRQLGRLLEPGLRFEAGNRQLGDRLRLGEDRFMYTSPGLVMNHPAERRPGGPVNDVDQALLGGVGQWQGKVRLTQALAHRQRGHVSPPRIGTN